MSAFSHTHEAGEPKGWATPPWFWAEIRRTAPPALFLAGIVGMAMNAIGAPFDLLYLTGTKAAVAAALRLGAFVYLCYLMVLAKRRPAAVTAHYDLLMLCLVGIVTLMSAVSGAWIPGGFGNFYYIAVLQVELMIFVFFPLPVRKVVPAILLFNLGYLAMGLAAGNPVDSDFVNLTATFVSFLVLGLGIQHSILRTRLRAYLSNQRAVALARKQTERAEILEENVQARTNELANTYERLQKQGQECVAAEQALREAESRYRKTIENSVSLVFDVAADLSLRLVRAPQQRLFNRPADEIDGQTLVAGLHEDDQTTFSSMLGLCRSDFCSRRIRTRVRYENGPWHWFEWACSFFEGADGLPSGVLLARDITQELQLQKEVERQSRLAAVGQLAAGITHDFNNALAGVRLGIDAAFAAGPLPTEAAAHLRRAAESAQRARTIIRRILDFSKRSPTLAETFDLSEFAAECAGFLRHLITNDITIEIQASEPAWVSLDASQLEQAIVNLAVNSKDAMPHGGVFRLRVEVLPEAVRLYVSDTGTGLSEEALAHLFEPFFTTKGEHGTGLGLAQVYGLVRQNGGAIMVDTQPGKGTCFTLEFPRLEPPAVVSAAAAIEGLVEDQPLPPWRILLVEDDAVLRALFELMLTNLGVQPVAVASAQAALQAIANEQVPFDLLVTDQSMPNMSGRDLALRVKQEHPKIKVLLITGLLTEERLLERAYPFDGVLLKPFDVTDLRQALTALDGLATEA